MRTMWHGGRILGLMALCAGPALAEEYPFSGLFTIADGPRSAEDVARHCALSFVEQRSDGDWFVYHVDLDGFRTDRSIRFVQVANGHCDYDGQTGAETCVTLSDAAFPEAVGTTVFDLVTEIAPDRVGTVFFADRADLDRALAGQDRGGNGLPQDYLRCPFAAERMMSLVTGDLSSAPGDEIDALRAPDATRLSDPLVGLLVERLGTP